ncbi:MAG: HAMP domain-containing histidine kinase [Cyclobacteriaceae bacterium]|nr:HAMP domain-containing histidine kinase [Cyclobacteriaceae bacterium]
MGQALEIFQTPATENEMVGVINQIEENLLWIDFSGEILKGNQTVVIKTGYSQSELSSMRIFDFCSGFNRSTWLLHINGLHKWKKVSFKCSFISKLGKVLPLSIKMVLATYNNKQCVCIIAKDYEKVSIESFNMKRIAYEYDKLSYRLSHDLRSPISTMLGLVNLMGKNASDDQKKCLRLIGKTLDKQEQLMTDIHNLSSIHTSTLENEEIIFKNLIDEIINDISENLETSTNYSFQYNLSKPFYSDSHLICKLLKCIINNASNYSSIDDQQSEVNIIVETNNMGVNLDISDNGFGIDPAIHHQLYEMFFRGTAYSKGSGLGLYVAKIIIDKLNGSIDFTTNSTGTTFKLFIPTSL